VNYFEFLIGDLCEFNILEEEFKGQSWGVGGTKFKNSRPKISGDYPLHKSRIHFTTIRDLKFMFC
jgi:hypothetical protein